MVKQREDGWVRIIQKPVELIQKFIELSTNEGDLVLDCFMGSGTTAVASIKSHRNYIGWEINKENYEESQKRLEQQNLKTFAKG